MLIHLGSINLCKMLNSIRAVFMCINLQWPVEKLPKPLSFFLVNMGILVLEPLLRLQRTIYVQILDKETG